MPQSAEPTDGVPVPRGRHAPPLEVRVGVQRSRLFRAAAAVFARTGYADASAEAISREAGMSKATFYEHFANKEECILALFDASVDEVLRRMALAVADDPEPADYEAWVRGSLTTFLDILTEHPDSAQTLLVEIIGAGPRAAARRDAMLDTFAEVLWRDNARRAPRLGHPTFAAREDAFAAIGAIVEVVARQLRTGQHASIREVAPTLERVLFGVLRERDRV